MFKKICKKLLLTLLLSLSSVTFTGCFGSREYLPTYKYKCVEQIKLERPKDTQVDISDNSKNLDVIQNLNNVFNSFLEFYEWQVDKNNEFCKEVENESK